MQDATERSGLSSRKEAALAGLKTGPMGWSVGLTKDSTHLLHAAAVCMLSNTKTDQAYILMRAYSTVDV